LNAEPALAGDAPVTISLAATVAAMPWCRVLELPRTPGEEHDEDRDPTVARRTAALLTSYVADDAVAVGWLRAARSPAISVLAGGRSLVAESGRVEPSHAGLLNRTVNLPAGASGSVRPFTDIHDRFAGFASWVRIGGVADALSVVERDPTEPPTPRPSLDDAVSAWQGAFAWMVVAVPIARAQIRREGEELSRRIPRLRAQAANSEEYAVDLERQEARYRELQRTELTGLWSISLLAGGPDHAAALSFASLLCGCLDLERLPYTLRPELNTSDLDGLLNTAGVDESFPLRGSTELLAALAIAPRRELPGVRLRPRSTFDVTPETQGVFALGTILDRSLANAGDLGLSPAALNRHTFVCGATGSGKSQTIRGLLEQISNHPVRSVPWLVIEPAKAEYRRMAGRLAGKRVIAIRPGLPEVVAAGLNPLEPEPGFPLQTHVDLIGALFLASFQSDEPFPQVLSASLTRCYEDLGWDLALGESRAEGVQPRYPTLGDLQRVARDVVTRIGYGPEITQNVRGFVDVRLSSLRHGTPGRFFEGGHPLDIARLLESNVVFEIEDVGDDRDKAFLMGTVIVRLVEHLRVRARHREGEPVTLRHLVVLEEAHRLLRRVEGHGVAAHAVELFASLLAEIRAYGEGVVVAEQIPSKIIPDTIKNSAVKVMHRLPAQDDRDAVGAAMNLTDAQSEYVVALRPGSAAVFTEGMDYPVLVRMPPREDRDSTSGLSFEPPLAGRFSRACGSLCRERACTLRDMRLAQRALEDDGRIAVWGELIVLAHILGFPSPEPGPELAGDLRALDRRRLECTVAHVIDRAVAVRSAGMTQHYSPADLVAHAAAVALAQVDGSPSPCGVEEWRWQAGPFRWNHIRAGLRAWAGDGEGDKPPHPDTPLWRRVYGVDVRGDTWAEQVATVQAWVDRERHHRALLLFGNLRPSPIEEAVGMERADHGWKPSLEKTLASLGTMRRQWANAYLAESRLSPNPDRAADVDVDF